MTEEQLQDLLRRYQQGNCSLLEKEAVENWYQNLLSKRGQDIDLQAETISGRRIKSKLDAQFSPVKKTIQIRILKWTAAAAILLIIGTAAYLYNTNSSDNSIVSVPSKDNKDIIAPGGNKAVLTLSDGTAIILDSAGNGQLATQNGSMVIKRSDGQLEYQPVSKQFGNDKINIVYNTMTTPRGGQYKLILPDGTRHRRDTH